MLAILIAVCALALSLVSCERDEGISIQVFPAVREIEKVELQPGWRAVTFEGDPRAAAGEYFVAEEPLITDWNILAFRTASQADGSVAVIALLNEYARQKMGVFSSDSTNVKKPLATQINGRWADFSPMLARIDDKMTLYGFTAEEARLLERELKTR